MLRYASQRLVVLLVSLVLASVLIFVILRWLPGDSAGGTLGVGATSDQLEELRRQLGTDRPAAEQYSEWIGGLVRGDAGDSFLSRAPVAELIAARLPVTLPLSLAAFALSVLISLPIGVLAAVRRRKPSGALISIASQLGVAVPIFWVGVILIAIFALNLGWLPPGGFPRQGWQAPGEAIRALILPALTIAIAMSAVMIRYIRSATLDVLDQDYIRTARALGYSRWQALARHGLRNAAVPVVAILGIELATSMLGAVVVEAVFDLPGVGSLLLSSVVGRDLAVVQTLVLAITATVLVINLGVDLAQRVIDPRLRTTVVTR
ncbi:ABC transporter permease [Bogoriella caseilytica]|uniref:Peptide/nickel transport system permease protein n=1 Tax=Bogoriella caseilytica TaxID=56055 RepID=A0A3N2B9K5_9MICO|nr:ABC transporter permease [Bogoriella caseilytica]ROR71946.1 peptide/nickel transport system permease protein [Bogoriella caseilytica]